MRYFSVFTGVGGFEIGIKNAYANHCEEPTGRGADHESSRITHSSSERKAVPSCIGFSEIDPYASAVLKYRFPLIKNYGDITKIDWKTVPDFDLLVGGSPCQDLSVAGKRRGLEGKRSGLFAEYVRTLHEKKPRYFIWENVKGALSSNDGRDFAVVLNSLAEEGYGLAWQVLQAKDFGVPQNRERVFILGAREGSARQVFLERKDDCDSAQRDRKEQGRSAANALTVSGAGGNNCRGNYVALTERRTEEAKQIRREMMRRGKDWSPRRGKGLVPRTDGIGNCVTASQGREHLLADGSRLRRLTPRECERLMSWPDDWTKWGVDGKGQTIELSDAQRYKMCGNGVVSEVVRTIIQNLN